MFHGHHLIPTNLFTKSELSSFWQKLIIQGYSQADLLTNQAWLPATIEDALRLGSAQHSTNHTAYDLFIENKIIEINSRALSAIAAGATENAAYSQALKDVHGLQQWVKYALQAVDTNGQPLLVLNDSDPRLNGLTAAQVNDAAHLNFKVYTSAGGTFVEGILKSDNYFQQGSNGVEPGGYGHKLDFAADGAHWDADARAKIIVHDIVVSHLKALGAGQINADDFRSTIGTSEFSRISAAIKSELVKLAPADFDKMVNFDDLGNEVLQSNPAGFLKWFKSIFNDFSSATLALLDNLPDELKSGLSKAIEAFKNMMVDESGTVHFPDSV